MDSPLVALSELLLLRVLAALSPEDLLVLGRTSRYFRAAASDATLWRRLYHSRQGALSQRTASVGQPLQAGRQRRCCQALVPQAATSRPARTHRPACRWPEGPQQEDAEHVQGASWQLLYIERDHQSVLEARQSAPSAPLLPIYLQMATARRSEPLSSADAQALYRSPASNRSLQLSAKVGGWAGGVGVWGGVRRWGSFCGPACQVAWPIQPVLPACEPACLPATGTALLLFLLPALCQVLQARREQGIVECPHPNPLPSPFFTHPPSLRWMPSGGRRGC